jgi:hypothetical protein
MTSALQRAYAMLKATLLTTSNSSRMLLSVGEK